MGDRLGSALRSPSNDAVADARTASIRAVSQNTPHIGKLREGPLHASLKQWYARPGDEIEVAVDGFVIDIVRDGLLIEIQTRGFSSMKEKLAALLEGGHDVRIVHPIPLDKWIVKIGEGGEILSRRRSPKHGMPSDIFTELVSFPDLMAHQGMEIELVLIEEEEIRRHEPDGPWRRKGWAVVERRLVEVIEAMRLSGMNDLADLLPSGLPGTFTTADLADGLSRRRRTAQQMAYCLRELNLIEMVDKRGNAYLYEIVEQD